MKNILILGVCGLIGSNLALKLLEDPNNHVIGTDNLENNDISPIYKHLRQENFEYVQADISQGINITADEIYYLAGSGDKSEYFENGSKYCLKQIKMIENAIKNAKLSGSKIVFCLERDEILNGAKLKLYLKLNNFIEELILNSVKNNSLNAKILKTTEVFGANFKKTDKRFINRAVINAINNLDIEITQDIEKHYIFIDDVTAALQDTMEKYFEEDVLTISREEKYKLTDIAKLIIKCAKSSSKLILKEGEFRSINSDILKIGSDFDCKIGILEGIYKTVNYTKFMEF